jgi:Fic family protein
MLSFKPDLKLERELKRLQVNIIESFNEVSGISKEETEYLNRFALISNIGASSRIENAVLTDHEIDWVDTALHNDGKVTAFENKKSFILDKLSKDKERSVEEVVGCREVLNTIYIQAKELFPLSETIIKGLHHTLLRYYPEAVGYAGDYKRVSNKVIFYNHETGEKRVVLETAPPGIITETAMAELVKWYNTVIREFTWPLLTAVEFVFRFLAIHPFHDGNGRLGRGLFIMALLQSDDVSLSRIAPFIAVDRHIEQFKSLYYSTLHQCSEGKFNPDPEKYNLEPLAWFFVKILTESLEDISYYRERFRNQQRLSESAMTVLMSFKTNPESRLKVADIVNETGLARRTVQYSLQRLSEQKFLQRLGHGAGTRYQLIF